MGKGIGTHGSPWELMGAHGTSPWADPIMHNPDRWQHFPHCPIK